MARAKVGSRLCCKAIVSLLRPTMAGKPKDAAVVLLPARLLQLVYDHARRGSRQ